MITQPPPPIQTHLLSSQDESHLNLLAVFHYVLGCLYLLGIGFLILHFMMMNLVLRKMPESSMAPHTTVSVKIDSNDSTSPHSEETIIPDTRSVPTQAPSQVLPVNRAFPKEIMSVLIIVYVVIALLILTAFIANILSGVFIKKRKHRMFSFIVAGLNCMQFPFGTALGVFTFIILSRESVKTAYAANP